MKDLPSLMERYGLRIIGRELRASGPAPWGGRRTDYDAAASWRETRFTVRRNLICERCGHRFGYNFQVDQISRTHRAGNGTDGALAKEIHRQLRRRVRCPKCGHAQKKPRASLVGRERRHTLLACSTVLGSVVLAMVLAVVGGLLLGPAGILVGLIVALALSFGLLLLGMSYILVPESPQEETGGAVE